MTKSTFARNVVNLSIRGEGLEGTALKFTLEKFGENIIKISQNIKKV